MNSLRRQLINARARGWGWVHRPDRVIRRRGSGSNPNDVRTYPSTWHWRRQVPYLGGWSHADYFVVQDVVGDDFLAFTGPKVFCVKEPPVLLPATTLAYLEQPGVRAHCYLFDDPDITRRMFYPTLVKDPGVFASRLEASVAVRRPRRCCFVNRWTRDFERSLIGERLRYLQAFGMDVDIYGGAPRGGVANGWLAYPNYHGAAADKRATIAGYDFIIAFENSDFDGYITEKIVDALVAGTIPLYQGGGRYLAESVPGDCFIDCRGQDAEAIHQRVMAMDFDEVVAYREAGVRFLRSAAAQRFTRSYWTEGVLERWREQEA